MRPRIFLPVRITSVGNPLLKSISTQIRAKVEVSCLIVSWLAKWNFPKAEPMASREGKPKNAREYWEVSPKLGLRRECQ
jgi:hypothetical protein